MGGGGRWSEVVHVKHLFKLYKKKAEKHQQQLNWREREKERERKKKEMCALDLTIPLKVILSTLEKLNKRNWRGILDFIIIFFCEVQLIAKIHFNIIFLHDNWNVLKSFLLLI